MFKYNFENLEVWKLSLVIIKESNKLISKLPIEEKYILSDQWRRATISISLNIAEGSGRGTKKDFKRFVRNAIGSTLEVISCVKIAIDQQYFCERECNIIDSLLKELYFKLIKLDKYLKTNNSNTFNNQTL